MFYYTKRPGSATQKIIFFLSANKTHFISWIAFMIYETIAVGLYSGQFSRIGNYIIHYALNITLFYIHAIFILPNALKERQKYYWRLPLYIGLEIGVYLAIIIIIDVLLLNLTNLFGVSKIFLDKHFYIGTIFRTSYFIGFSTGYYFLRQYITASRRANELEKIRLNNIIINQKIEYSLTMSQISPHFLFNTLDFIYHHTRKTDSLAADAIVTLSTIMRFAADSINQGDFILLNNEIEQIENVIHLHQLKNKSNLHIELSYTEEIKKINFIPLVLITLTENIFKHGDLTKKGHPALIKLYQKNNTLFIETENLISKTPNSRGLNLGLSNIIKRLQYCYGDLASFDFKTVDNHFKVLVSVKKIDMGHSS